MSHSKRCSALLAALGLSLLAACGGANTDDPYDLGLAAAKKGDHQAAVVQYEKALGAVAATAPEFREIQLARIESLVQLGASDARTKFLVLCEENAGVFQPDDYMKVFGWLCAKGEYLEGGYIAKGIEENFEDSGEVVARMESLIKEAFEAGKVSDAQRQQLESLGYL